MSRKIWQLFFMMAMLIGALIAVDKWMSSEGQIFQILATAVATISAVLYSALRHEFGIPDATPGTTTSSVSATTTTVQTPDPNQKGTTTT